jgi:hypothetical protein
MKNKLLHSRYETNLKGENFLRRILIPINVYLDNSFYFKDSNIFKIILQE